MASAFGHAFSAIAFGSLVKKELRSPKLWLIGIFCSVCPDFDVIAFKFGIPYGHMFGHRGITHSISFSILLAFLVMFLFYKKYPIKSRSWMVLFLYFFICTVSHAFLDAMTTGGKGVALFAPFSGERHFLPWRMIKVSPMSISAFFNGRAGRILASEAFWIGIPSVVIIIIGYIKDRLQKK